MSDWVLAIDFGTTSTAAAIRVGDRVQLVAIEGAPQMSSMVFWREGTVAAQGELVLGRRIENLAGRAPWCLERTPKRRIAEEVMQLGDKQVRVVDAIAEILRKVAGEATRLRGGQRPAEVRLTHPARWGRLRIDKLRQAATEAGFAAPVLLAEPVAAAVYFASERLSPGEHVAVYDLGGGTFDTAVLRRTTSGFEVAGSPGGREDLGGEDFDDLLYRHLGAQLPPDQWRALRGAATNRETTGNAWREANVALRREARLAKEILSDSPDYDVRIPVPVDTYLSVRADELHRLIRPDLEQTVLELERTIETAGLGPADLAAIYLAGGSSRIPLVSQLITRRLGQSPEYLEDPKSVIALGAARAPLGAYASPPPAPRPAPVPPRPSPTPAGPRPPEPLAPPAPGPPPPPTDPGALRTPAAPTDVRPDRRHPPPPTDPAPGSQDAAAPPEPRPDAASQTWPQPRGGSENAAADTRPAAPSPGRRRAAAVGLAAVALVLVAVALAVALGGGKGSTGNAAALDGLHRIESILAVSAQGRGLIAQSDFNGAIANRRAVLKLLDGLGPVAPVLRPSVRALRAAESASLAADVSLRACGAGCSQSTDAAATALKQRFVGLYDPLAARYGTETFSPGQI